MTRTFFILGALLGALAVIMGAFGAHALQNRLAPESLEIYHTAARYQIYHAFALLAAAWAAERWPGAAANAAGWCFLAGTVLFCGALYLLAFGAPRWLGAVAPVGGLGFIAGWVMLAVAAWRGR
jgi:uncharacterized membrane protein YgdD (TMEM256/DUF423 family)